MARKLTVRYAQAALASLDEIWDWNAQEYGPDHAGRYVVFLKLSVDRVALNVAVARNIPGRPDLRYVTAKRRPQGHGHVIVFRIVDDVLEVMKLYHTAQDWHGRIESGEI